MEWRNKLYHYEERPPEHVWANVSEELGQDAPVSLREGLYTLQETPPPHAWDQITAALKPEEPVRLKRSSGVWRVALAAAAATVAFVAFFLNRDTAVPKVSVSMIRSVQPAPTPAPVPEPKTSTPIPSVDPLPPSSQHESVSNTAVSPAPKSTKTPARLTVKDPNYIYFTSRSGDQRRLSYKLEKMLPAIRSQERNDTVTRWTSTLEHSSFVPCGNNFFDILELVKLIEQQKQ